MNFCLAVSLVVSFLLLSLATVAVSIWSLIVFSSASESACCLPPTCNSGNLNWILSATRDIKYSQELCTQLLSPTTRKKLDCPAALDVLAANPSCNTSSPVSCFTPDATSAKTISIVSGVCSLLSGIGFVFALKRRIVDAADDAIVVVAPTQRPRVDADDNLSTILAFTTNSSTAISPSPGIATLSDHEKGTAKSSSLFVPFGILSFAACILVIVALNQKGVEAVFSGPANIIGGAVNNGGASRDSRVLFGPSCGQLSGLQPIRVEITSQNFIAPLAALTSLTGFPILIFFTAISLFANYFSDPDNNPFTICNLKYHHRQRRCQETATQNVVDDNDVHETNNHSSYDELMKTMSPASPTPPRKQQKLLQQQGYIHSSKLLDVLMKNSIVRNQQQQQQKQNIVNTNAIGRNANASQDINSNNNNEVKNSDFILNEDAILQNLVSPGTRALFLAQRKTLLLQQQQQQQENQINKGNHNNTKLKESKFFPEYSDSLADSRSLGRRSPLSTSNNYSSPENVPNGNFRTTNYNNNNNSRITPPIPLAGTNIRNYDIPQSHSTSYPFTNSNTNQRASSFDSTSGNNSDNSPFRVTSSRDVPPPPSGASSRPAGFAVSTTHPSASSFQQNSSTASSSSFYKKNEFWRPPIVAMPNPLMTTDDEGGMHNNNFNNKNNTSMMIETQNRNRMSMFNATIKLNREKPESLPDTSSPTAIHSPQDYSGDHEMINNLSASSSSSFQKVSLSDTMKPDEHQQQQNQRPDIETNHETRRRNSCSDDDDDSMTSNNSKTPRKPLVRRTTGIFTPHSFPTTHAKTNSNYQELNKNEDKYEDL